MLRLEKLLRYSLRQSVGEGLYRLGDSCKEKWIHYGWWIEGGFDCHNKRGRRGPVQLVPQTQYLQGDSVVLLQRSSSPALGPESPTVVGRHRAFRGKSRTWAPSERSPVCVLRDCQTIWTKAQWINTGSVLCLAISATVRMHHGLWKDNTTVC